MNIEIILSLSRHRFSLKYRLYQIVISRFICWVKVWNWNHSVLKGLKLKPQRFSWKTTFHVWQMPRNISWLF